MTAWEIKTFEMMSDKASRTIKKTGWKKKMPKMNVNECNRIIASELAKRKGQADERDGVWDRNAGLATMNNERLVRVEERTILYPSKPGTEGSGLPWFFLFMLLR